MCAVFGWFVGFFGVVERNGGPYMLRSGVVLDVSVFFFFEEKSGFLLILTGDGSMGGGKEAKGESKRDGKRVNRWNECIRMEKHGR